MALKKRKQNTYPYQNTSLKNLTGEKWKDIAGFEGFYQVSNYGRIKSLERTGITCDGRRYRVTEKIRKPRLGLIMNKTIQAPAYALTITLNKAGEVYNVSVGRLVYHAFIEKFDIKNLNILITFRDYDGRNVHVSNLIKSDGSTVSLRAYEEGRAISHVSFLQKTVSQFDSKGKFVKQYPSIYQAGKVLNIDAGVISAAANGHIKTYKGFFWRFGKHKRTLDLSIQVKNKNGETINKDLMKRFKIKSIDPKNIPAFLNLSIETMKGEKWKDIPGYEGYFQVSNLGRVKTLQRFSKTDQRQQWIPEKIKSLSVYLRNKAGKKVPVSMFVNLFKDQINKSVTVSRIVYHLFVKRIKLEDSGLRVSYKDGNPLNCNCKNLYLKGSITK